ncbi:uncharacterized protein LOC129601495 [Paramacrobiotus metropolitanus]|uniref:uncharacterized protein LOC129601495 n=1 Tax=Paramacrobiotus metropolitanus TaxID=2943436 RepID=UPI0024464407|nr:uncharacterized protein LOC129601495 [Paramacrobiotus metropolitanus]
MHPWTNCVWSALLLKLLRYSTGKSLDDGFQNDNAGMFRPLPNFNTELMTRDQCELQFTAHCGVRFNVSGSLACAQNQGLAINCSSQASNEEVRHLAIALCKPPLKAVFISLNDGPLVVFENVAPVREQTVVFQLHNCRSTRATKKLAQLRLPHLLEFSVHNCRALDVRLADFWQSAKLRLIQFANTTLNVLEEGTFADLPGLRLLSLERGLVEMLEYPEDIHNYIVRLHCGCEFKQFRRWFSNSGLMQYANEGQIYRIEYDSWRNEDLEFDNVFLPIDCTEAAFPNKTLAIRSSLYSFSVNEDLYNDPFSSRCENQTKTVDESLSFSSQPMTDNECAVQLLNQCTSMQRDYSWCDEHWPHDPFVDVNCTDDERVRETREVAKALSRQPPRPTVWTFYGNLPVVSSDIAPIRQTIFLFELFNCISSRSTALPGDFGLTSLLHFSIWYCSDLDVERDDFQRLQKLRILTFVNTTIRSLQSDSFSDLTALSLLSLEAYDFNPFSSNPARDFEPRYREYLWRLHCGCDFAWFRQWWTNNTLLLHENDTVWGEVYTFRGFATSSPLSRRDIYLPIDCAIPIPRSVYDVKYNETAYSRHAEPCKVQ